MLADVLVEVITKGNEKTFTYHIPDSLKDDVCVGKRVLVLFGRQEVEGYVLSLKDKVDIELYSSKDNFELLEGKKKIDGLSIRKDKKDKITYTLKLTQRKNPTDKQYVNVKITEDK